MKTNLTITAAGNAALTAAGPDAVEITGIAVGLAPRILPDITGVTALQSEITRTDFRGDAGASPGSIAGYGLFEGDDAWTALEVGVYAAVGDADEILFAYALAAANTAGVRVPLLTKTAGEDARYDFAFIFSPSSDAATPCAVPTPCSVPATAVPLSVSCFAPPYYYAPPPPPPLAPPAPPLKQRVWRSINTRQPHDDDVAHPVGHLWIHGTKEWTLESITDGAALWRQTKGVELIYSASTSPNSQNAAQYQFTLDRDMTFYSVLSFNIRNSSSGAIYRNYTTPLQISTQEFLNGNFLNTTDGASKTIKIERVNNTTIIVRIAERKDFYISSVWGIY